MKFQDFVDTYFPGRLTKTQMLYCETLLKNREEGKIVVIWPRLAGRKNMCDVLRAYMKNKL